MEDSDNKKQRLATAANTPKQLSFYVIIIYYLLLLRLIVDVVGTIAI